MQIELEIGAHCIQTAAKQAYERIVSWCLAKDASNDNSADWEREIECLVFFLKNADFPSLRSLYPDLGGQRRHRIYLVVPDDFSKMKIQWDDRQIKPLWKQKKAG